MLLKGMCLKHSNETLLAERLDDLSVSGAVAAWLPDESPDPAFSGSQRSC